MIINTINDLCFQSINCYLQLQLLIHNRWLPWKHIFNAIDEEPGPNWSYFLKYSELEQNRTIIIKEPELNMKPKFSVLSHL